MEREKKERKKRRDVKLYLLWRTCPWWSITLHIHGAEEVVPALPLFLFFLMSPAHCLHLSLFLSKFQHFRLLLSKMKLIFFSMTWVYCLCLSFYLFVLLHTYRLMHYINYYCSFLFALFSNAWIFFFFLIWVSVVKLLYISGCQLSTGKKIDGEECITLVRFVDRARWHFSQHWRH